MYDKKEVECRFRSQVLRDAEDNTEYENVKNVTPIDVMKSNSTGALMTLLSIIVMLLHIIVVFYVGLTVMISTNKYSLLILFILISLVYLQAIMLDGCVASKLEGPIPFTNLQANDLVLAFFGLKPEDISLPNLEKILIGFTLFFVGIKLGSILAFEYVFDKSVYNQMCIFLHSRKNWYEKMLAYYV
jgi:hypothetical protein